MTVGFWYEEAQRAMRAATAAVTRRRAETAAEINGLVDARSDLYHQLARVTELLVGGRPAAELPDRATAGLVLGRHGKRLTRFYVGLRAAAVVDERLPPAPGATAGAARWLRRAADAIGVMGDIIAGHVPPGGRPGTPEGVAIRAGGGVQGGLGDIARLAVDAVRLDGRLPAWLDRGGPLAQTYKPVAEAARWTSGSRLGGVAKELIAGARTQPNLRELDIARPPQHPAPAVNTVNAAIATVRAARTWLWLHPDQVTGAHLQVGTQLGLAVHVLRTDGSLAMIGGWRQAAIAAAELRAAPAAGPGQDAAAELGEALRWTRSLLNPGAQGSMPHRVREATRLGSEMVLMAATLHRGLRTAMQRRNLFVRGIQSSSVPPVRWSIEPLPVGGPQQSAMILCATSAVRCGRLSGPTPRATRRAWSLTCLPDRLAREWQAQQPQRAAARSRMCCRTTGRARGPGRERVGNQTRLAPRPWLPCQAARRLKKAESRYWARF